MGPILILLLLSPALSLTLLPRDSVFWRCYFCRKFTHFSGVQFIGQKTRWRTKNDKYQVCYLLPKTHFLVRKNTLSNIVETLLRCCVNGSNTDFAVTVAISCSVPYPPPKGLSCANAVWPKGKTLIFIAWSPSSKC